MCYTCVRECPAKAISVSRGQAIVIPERCIACGNCVKVCSQNAKVFRDDTDRAFEILSSQATTIACVAPSFPAEFRHTYQRVVGGIKALGFRYVVEVALGADLVAHEYARLMSRDDNRKYIATTCPAAVGYIERYFPQLACYLVPIVSPMIATARAMRKLHGRDAKIIFIGPCLAKKIESESPCVEGDVDVVLTFSELRKMFGRKNIDLATADPQEFDPPHPSSGTIFPISRGILHAAGISDDPLLGHVTATEGRIGFQEAIKEFAEGNLNCKLLELLSCKGCYMGAGMTTDDAMFTRRENVSRYARHQIDALDCEKWQRAMEALEGLDLTRKYQPSDQRCQDAEKQTDITRILAQMGKTSPQDELNCGACGYDTCRKHAAAILYGLAENAMCLPYAIDQLKRTVRELASAQEALIQSEKLANMGQLAAGIAHEINNPLGVVLIFANMLMKKVDPQSPSGQDLTMIVEQAERCKNIITGLLNFSRRNKVSPNPTNIVKLVDHTVATLVAPQGVEKTVEHDLQHQTVEIDADQIVQVLTNLITNAYAAMPNGGKLSVQTLDKNQFIHIVVKDTGEGIQPENLGKLFTPFFTTKPAGKGTGLGLAISFGIVKMHRGEIIVESNVNPDNGPTGTTFTITLPKIHSPLTGAKSHTAAFIGDETK